MKKGLSTTILVQKPGWSNPFIIAQKKPVEKKRKARKESQKALLPSCSENRG